MTTLGGHDEDDPAPDFRPIAPAVRWGVPVAALELYSRWWQFETWLRQLVYVELRAALGISWEDGVPKVAPGRTGRDARAPYMGTADDGNLLAYLDFSQLVEVIGNNWDKFEVSLIERPAWVGRIEELTRIRHRIGHLRRPHEDDRQRLVQILRDLQLGTFIAFATYNRQFAPEPDKTDPLTNGWVLGSHPTAQRLLRHAWDQYSTNFRLARSRRPWVGTERTDGPGWLWHANFSYSVPIDAGELWADSGMRSVKPLVLHCLTDRYSTILTFADVDDHEAIAGAIGSAFDSILLMGRYGKSAHLGRPSGIDLDFRIMEHSGWNIVTDDTVPIDNFGVGNGVMSCPPLP